MKYVPLPSIVLVGEALHYDPLTGLFRWRNNRGKMRAGDLAGAVSARPDRAHIQINLGRRLYKAHRLAWLLMTGEDPREHIDHANRDATDNRWANLRLATPAQNLANQKRRADNTSGFKGVTFDRAHRGTKKWAAKIMKDRHTINLGRFVTPEEAHAAYCRAAADLYGEFARAG